VPRIGKYYERGLCWPRPTASPTPPSGESNAAIGRRLAIDADTAGKWRQRFCRSGIEGLIDLPRSGRPRTFTAEVVAGVKALACELPQQGGGADDPVELPRGGA
jgi:hypothetical protein